MSAKKVAKVRAYLWLILVLALWSARANGQEVSLVLAPGLDQLRNHEETGFRAFQLVRGLPPTNELYVLTVKVPEAWISSDRPKAGLSEVGALNDKHVRLLRKAMVQRGIFGTNDPLLLAGRVVALLRPMEIDGMLAPARHIRIWPLWESLVYSQDVDTLSVALAAVQFLESVGVPARVASYPAISSSICFGVEVKLERPRIAGGTEPWAQPVGDKFLLPVALAAKPAPGLQQEEVHSWTSREVLSTSWTDTRRVDSNTLIPLLPAEFPDIDTQRKALGFLHSDGPALSRVWSLSLMLGLSGISVLGWLMIRLHQDRLRKKRVEARRKSLKENEF